MKNNRLATSIVILISVVGLLFTLSICIKPSDSLRAKDMPRGSDVITPSNYKTWTAEKLEDAQTAVSTFLTEHKKTGARPYQDNQVWTEGSLMALDQAYTVTLDSMEGVGENLARQFLIQTVQKLQLALELAGLEAYELPRNNYPDTDLSYLMDFLVDREDSEYKKYDIIFSLDWSGSMGSHSGSLGTSFRLHAKTMIQSMAKSLIEQGADTRIKLMGMNSEQSNSVDGKDIHADVDTDFISINDDYQAIIESTFQKDPTNRNDNVPYFIKAAHDNLLRTDDQGLREGATPIIVMLSDFQLASTNGPTNTGHINYQNFLSKYYNDPILNARSPKQKPIYLATSYNSNSNNPSGAFRPGDKGILYEGDDLREKWAIQNIELNTSSATAQSVFASMVDGAMSPVPWKVNLTTEKFNYQDGSLTSTNNTITQTELTPKSLSFTGPEKDTGSYGVSYDKATKGTAVMGDQANISATATLNSEAFLKKAPEVFLPITDAAIEVYGYKGSGDRSDPANYTLGDTIVGTNYQSLTGKEYDYKHADLSSFVYGDTMTAAKAKSIITSALPAAEADKYNFDKADLPTASTMAFNFNAGKNVYRVYGDSKRKITVEHRKDKTDGELLATDDFYSYAGLPYTANSLSIPDYELMPGSESTITVTPEGEDVTVVFIYRAKEVDMIVEYVRDDTGLPIKNVDTGIAIPSRPAEKLRIGAAFDANDYKKEFEGFELVRIDGSPGIQVPNSDFTIKIVYKGVLKLVNVTSDLEFGLHQLITLGSKDIKADKSIQASIMDTRDSSQDWQLFLKLETDLSHTVSGKTFKGSVQFINSLDVDKKVSTTSQSVETRSVNEFGKTSLEWDKDNRGIYLNQLPGNQTGAYEGKLIWNLTDGY